MAWVRIDDQAWSHPKLVGISGNAARLWIFSLCWSNNHSTDGKIPTTAIRILGATKRQAKELVERGLWHEIEGGWTIHDFLDYQPSAAENQEKRAARAAAGRIGGQRSGESRRRANHEAKPKQMLPEMARVASTKTNPGPARPDPVPIDPKATTTGLGESQNHQKRQQRPRNLNEALKVPISERAEYILDNPTSAQWLEPHCWPEVQAFGNALSASVGWVPPRWKKPSKTAEKLAGLFAEFSIDELARAARAAANDPTWFQGRGLEVVSDAVIRRLLSGQRREETKAKPETDEDYMARRRREKLERELGYRPIQAKSAQSDEEFLARFGGAQ